MKGFSSWSWFLILLSATVFLGGLDFYSIYILDESKNAEAAREMWIAEIGLIQLSMANLGTINHLFTIFLWG